MRIYIRPFKDMPKCKHCGVRMDYWIPGLPEDQHAHPECEGRAIAKQMDLKFSTRITRFTENGSVTTWKERKK